MKRVFGWVAVAVLSPIVLIGLVAFLIVDALVFGWETMEKFLDDL